jgi:hypothetical protein
MYDQFNDQDPCCSLSVSILVIGLVSKHHGSWSECADAQAGLDPCWSQTHYVGFVVTRLIYSVSCLILSNNLMSKSLLKYVFQMSRISRIVEFWIYIVNEILYQILEKYLYVIDISFIENVYAIKIKIGCGLKSKSFTDPLCLVFNNWYCLISKTEFLHND